MSAGEIIGTITAAIAGNTLMVAALAWVAKGLINGKLTKALERYKSELKQEADLSIEREKAALAALNGAKLAELDAELTRIQHDRQIRYARLYEHRFLAVGELYRSLADARKDIATAVSFIEPPNAPPAKQRFETAVASWAQAEGCFERNRPYFPKSICDAVAKIIDSMDDAMRSYSAGRMNIEHAKGIDLWQNAWQNVKGPIKEALDELESELRAMLEPDDNSPSTV